MRPIPISRRPLRSALAVLTAGVVLAGCGSEAGPVDDGSYSALQAGAPAALESVGIELVAPTLPAGTDPFAVEAFLAVAGLPAPQQHATSDATGLGFDPTKVAGLLGTVSTLSDTKVGEQRYVVLVFDDPDSAVVWAQGAPAVFGDTDLDDVAQGYVAGSVVGYYVPGDGVDETTAFVGAFEQLAGLDPAASATSSGTTDS